MMQKNALDFWFIMLISSSQPSTERVTCSVQLMFLSVIQYFHSISLSFFNQKSPVSIRTVEFCKFNFTVKNSSLRLNTASLVLLKIVLGDHNHLQLYLHFQVTGIKAVDLQEWITWWWRLDVHMHFGGWGGVLTSDQSLTLWNEC